MEKEVTREGLFELAIEWHLQNLLSSLPHFKDGRILDPSGCPLQEGISENPYTRGCLVFFDGKTILEKAKELALRKLTGIRETTSLSTEKSLVDYLGEQQDNDSTYFLNTADRNITKVKGELSNAGVEDLDTLLEMAFPADFLSHDRSVPVSNSGNKTGIASIVTRRYNDVEAVMVKNTAYDFGLGKVAHIKNGLLCEEFFFKYAPESSGPFFDAEHSIVGVYRRYEPRENVDENGEIIIKPYLVEEKILNPKSLNIFLDLNSSVPSYTIRPPLPLTPMTAAAGDF